MIKTGQRWSGKEAKKKKTTIVIKSVKMSTQPNRTAMKCGDIFICIKMERLDFNLSSFCLAYPKVWFVLEVE